MICHTVRNQIQIHDSIFVTADQFARTWSDTTQLRVLSFESSLCLIISNQKYLYEMICFPIFCVWSLSNPKKISQTECCFCGKKEKNKNNCVFITNSHNLFFFFTFCLFVYFASVFRMVNKRNAKWNRAWFH